MIFAARAEPHREAVVRQNPVINTVNEIYKALFFDNFSKLYHYTLTILKNEEETKDVVQSAFLKLWLKEMKLILGLRANLTSILPYIVYH